jgi:outer membrane murein-binding lipoprotein Lpp
MKTWFLVLTAALIVSGAVGRTQNQPATPDVHAMMANQQKMMATMRATDKKLDELVAQMNAARGNDRIDKVIAVVNELAAAHKQMGGMMSMHGGMMQGMMNMPMGGQKPAANDASPQPEKR